MLGSSGWKRIGKIRIPWNKYIPHDPTPKQLAFLMLLDIEEAFYGGAAAGGKSDCLLMAALQYIDVPGYAALILRKSYTDLSLPGALMERAQEWLAGTDAKWIEKDKTWKIPKGGTLTFGYLEHERDKYRYKSSEFQFIGFDELTQFTITQYQYLFSRLRKREGVKIPLRMRSASNPGDVGHEWVKQCFIIEGIRKGRPFIPARIEDNPYVDEPSYLQSLSHLDPVTRRQLMKGDWEIREKGKKFQRDWFEIVDEVPSGHNVIVRYWDQAATEPKPGKDPDWTAGCKMAMTPDGIYYIMDMKRIKGTPLAVKKLTKQTADEDGIEVYIVLEQEPGASGVNTIDDYQRNVLRGFTFYGNKTTGSKEVRANPLSSAAEAGNVKLVRGPWISDFLDEAEAFPSYGVHDDQVDAASGAFEKCNKLRPQLPSGSQETVERKESARSKYG